MNQAQTDNQISGPQTAKRTKTVKLVLSKSTTGTHMYREEEIDRFQQTFPVIYVQKRVFGPEGSVPPNSITVTIEY